MASALVSDRLRDTASFLVLRLALGVLGFAMIVAPLPILIIGAALMLPVLLGAAVVRAWRRRDWIGGVRRDLARLPEAVARWVVPWVLAWRAAAQREREEVARRSRRPLPPPYRPLPDAGRPQQAAALAADPATWKDAVYFAATTALALLCAAACIAALGLLAAPVVLPVALSTLGDGGDQARTAGAIVELLLSDGGAALLMLGILMLTVAVGPLLIRAAAGLQIGLAQSLLGTSQQARLRAEVGEQLARRRLAVDAAEAERRRIERDLHDGAQQRLVSLALNLGRAREKFATDPAGAQGLVAEAHAEAKQALAELRDLARGIHPAVLADRGLDAALSALARRAAVPVDVMVALPDRPPPTVEAAAYFVIAEALTNIGRHAGATRASVTVTTDDPGLVVEVTDDGVGGADASAGTGIAGLSERLAAVDGRLEIHSPPGGPTRIRAELPCAW